MPDEARLEQVGNGLAPVTDGWFVVNARDAAWWRQRDVFGYLCRFEGLEDAHFPELGINLRVLQPGEPNCRYHGQSSQEDFLVLSGECILVIEGEERPLQAWDFVHCPGGTEHVFVGAGSGPCVMLMVGSRGEQKAGDFIVYPVSEAALKHGAGVETESHDPREAYADLPTPRRERLPELGLPWQ
jgi:uncharacterized cupin superfamily protein